MFFAIVGLSLSLNGPLVDTTAGVGEWPLRVEPFTYEQTDVFYRVEPVLKGDGVQGFHCGRAGVEDAPSIRFIDEYRALGGRVLEDGSCSMAVYGDGTVVDYRVLIGE